MLIQEGCLSLAGQQVPACCPGAVQALCHFWPQPLPAAKSAGGLNLLPHKMELPGERLVCKLTAQGKPEKATWCSFFCHLNVGLDSFVFRSSGNICAIVRAPSEGCGVCSWSHRTIWVGRDFKDHLVPALMPWAGTSSSRPSCSKLHPTCPLEHFQGWGTHSFFGKPVPVTASLQMEVLSYSHFGSSEPQ